MKALSIRQPWAWAIIHAGKNIENRSWSTNVRGRILIHASKYYDRREHGGDIDDIVHTIGIDDFVYPEDRLDAGFGGIIGTVEIVDCVTDHDSPWFFGPYGLVLRNPVALPFTPWKGSLGFFDIPEEEVAGL